MSVTTLIAIFKEEKDHLLEENQIRLNVTQNYRLIWDILKLPGIRILTLALITARVNTFNYNMIYSTFINDLFLNCYLFINSLDCNYLNHE